VASGGKVVTVANLDNLGATLDPLLLGLHAAHGASVTCEVVDKVGSDRGGIPVRWNGRPVVLEEFRLPEGFDANGVRVFSTNTFHFDARALSSLDMAFTYFTVKKTVDGRAAIQFERLVGEVTSHLDTRYARVPRSGAHSRFLPVKDEHELTLRRSDIESVARARGMLG
jgi:UTP--glucose-1-phosphate uridylyltransferase